VSAGSERVLKRREFWVAVAATNLVSASASEIREFDLKTRANHFFDVVAAQEKSCRKQMKFVQIGESPITPIQCIF
jgi:hypothetical protein